jgi:hypothetical protein
MKLALLFLVLFPLETSAAPLDIGVARKMLEVKPGDHLLLPALTVTAGAKKCRTQASLVTIEKVDEKQIYFRNPGSQSGAEAGEPLCDAKELVAADLGPAREIVQIADDRVVMWDNQYERELALTFVPKQRRATAKCPYDPGGNYRLRREVSSPAFAPDGKKKDCLVAMGAAVKVIGCTSAGRAIALVQNAPGKAARPESCVKGDILLDRLPLEQRFPLTDKLKSLFGGSTGEEPETDSAPAE